MPVHALPTSGIRYNFFKGLEAGDITIEFAIKDVENPNVSYYNYRKSREAIFINGSWKLEGHERASYQSISNDNGTSRNPLKKSIILEGQIMILSHPRYVYKQNTKQIKSI